MAGSSFQKRERERAKQQKAAAKRDRRQGQVAAAADDDGLDAPPTASPAETEQLLKAIETLHQRFDAGDISHEDFEEQKADLFARLPID